MDQNENMGKTTGLFPIFGKNYKPRPNPLNSIADAIQKSTPPRRKRSLLGKKETPGLVQMVLDAGQKNIGPQLCRECGLLYSPGDIEDEEEHRKAHARLDKVHTVTLWKNPRIVQNFLDGGYIVAVKVQGDNTVPKHVTNRLLEKLKNFLDWVDNELGVFEDPDLVQQMFLYMYPTKRKNAVRILGYAAIELFEANQVENQVVARPISEPDESAYLPGIPLRVGITRLWTDKLFRHKKIATRLVEAIRFNTGILGYVAPKNSLGILEPSEDGIAFMRKYSDSVAYSYTKK